MAKNKKHDISDYELFKLQEIDNFAGDFMNAMNKSLLNRLKKFLIYLAPAAVLFISFFIFKQPILLALATGSIGLPSLIEIIKDVIENEKSFKDPNYVPKDDFSEIDEILHRDLTKSPQDFYTEELKDAIATPIPEEREKYLKTLLAQKERRIESLKSRKALEITVLDEVVDYLEAFDATLNVSEDTINRIFDYIYSYLQTQNKTEKYYELIELIMRTVVQNAVSRRQKAINLENFTASFKFLLEIGLVSEFENIDVLFKEITEFISVQGTLSEETTQNVASQCKIIEFKPKIDQNKNP